MSNLLPSAHLIGSGERAQRFPEGRRCQACSTPLSAYNPGDRCTLHRHSLVFASAAKRGKMGTRSGRKTH